jgi:hypothetical protein
MSRGMSACDVFREMLHDRLLLGVEVALRTIPDDVIQQGFLEEHKLPEARIVGAFDFDDVERYMDVLLSRLTEWVAASIANEIADNGGALAEVVRDHLRSVAEQMLPDELTG